MQVGVLGLGALGADAATKLRALGFRVAGWSATPKRIEGVEAFTGAEGLMRLLARTDMLVVLLPLTPETRGMLNAGLFAILKQEGPLGGPVLINAGRGGLQVEADIVAALECRRPEGRIARRVRARAAAGGFAALVAPAVYVSPHNAAISEPGAIVAAIARQIEAFERGEALSNVVDRARGYRGASWPLWLTGRTRRFEVR